LGGTWKEAVMNYFNPFHASDRPWFCYMHLLSLKQGKIDQKDCWCIRKRNSIETVTVLSQYLPLESEENDDDLINP
jgi:hypothetical protein